MEWTNKIESAPRNGDFVILQDSLTGSWEVGRWVEESKNWAQIDGSPLRIFPTHWMPVSNDPAGSKSTQRFSLRNRRRLVLALTIVISIGGGIVASDLGIFGIGRTNVVSIDKKVSSEPDQKQSGELANLPGRELATAREEAKNMEFEQALAKSTARADKLADKADKLAKELAAESAANIDRVSAVQTDALQAKLVAEAKNKELKQALDDSTARADKLTKDLAAETAANSKSVSSLGAQALKLKSVAEAKNKELKQALEVSSDRAEKLAGELAAEAAANTKRINALQADALQAKLATEAEEKELKQAFDAKTAKTEALAGELKSARENIAVAKKSRGAGIAAQADLSPTGSLDRAVQRANAAPAGAVADVSRPPSPSLPKASLSSAEEARLVARADSLIEQVDIADARLLLKYGSDKGSARATFMLAETYDSQTLRSLQAYGVSGDTAMARKLYELAAAAGIDQARERLESLNAKPEH